MYGIVSVDTGATLSCGNGGYALEAYENVTNSGTIAGTSNAAFVFLGQNLINNNAITVTNFKMNSASSISGAGSFKSSTISIEGSGNVSLESDVTFSPITSFIINAGRTFNLNTQTFTLASGRLLLNVGSTVTNSGLFQTQGTVALSLRTGSNFNAPLKVISGITTANDLNFPFIGSLYGPVTVDVGGTLSVGNGGYQLNIYRDVTNNGTIIRIRRGWF